MYILTTPGGTDLPASATEKNLPLLVRLGKDFFDFSQAKANGEDIRFSAEGRPLAYQVEERDAAKGTAGIWVRIPVIKGNAHQEIKMFWGKADAVSESKGNAVFNESNGYLCVFHMADPVKDEVGALEAKDTGTAVSAGVIGMSRRFEPGKGINCGVNITTFPTGSSPNSTEVWFKAERVNTRVMAWGREQRDGEVALELQSPPRMKMVSGFCCADVEAGKAVVMSQWTHVMHTYVKDDSRIYINGRLEGVSTAKGGLETIAAVDKPGFTMDAGRVSGDQSMTLTLKAVYADTVKNLEIPVTVKDEKPVDHQFFARDDRNEGTLFYNGTLTNAVDYVFLKLYADDKLDNYGKAPAVSITAPNLRRASFAGGAKDAIALEFDQPVVWNDSLISEFHLDGAKGMVVSGTVSGNVVTLKPKEPSAAKKITYIKETNWSQDRLLLGANGIAALTFAEVEIGLGR
ncbi:MAG: DUF2341 domain-containing protein [Verrucomicrobia bacterium]|nr:DUF2341 domain-containing protein [Verrucomicrobiota bacterium]